MDESSSPISAQLYTKAINAALDSRWEDAIKLNREIIKLDPQNVDALNRQAKAYMELGKCNLAKKYYANVLKFDPYNPIALKNLKIIKSFKSGRSASLVNASLTNGHPRLSPSLFLQEPGKTKIVNLMKVAEPQKLSHVYCGMQVELQIKNRKIIVADFQKEYLGVLPDDTAHLLIRLIRGGNKYQSFIKSIRVNSLSILIREVFRSKRFRNQPSFLENTNHHISSAELITPLEDETEDQLDESEELEV